ncbi:ATP-binding protein [Streptomyces sp. MST-110588]|uniref:ATP-binding protein n=1 Tax=Streptomyces sp. MST-110588 TaxID=2833628 RepID=UPI001F5DDDDA|nr:ATP-binding protein [Streptomyces sp. MST-110588]UNO42149.1 ATP-binding protein [Streptomyces sp. MST-110588]
MAVAALDPEILEELRTGCATNAIPTVLDYLSLTLDREYLTADGDVPSTTAVWVGRVRRIGRAKLTVWGLSALVDDVQLLISELVTNGFRHGSGRHITFRLVIGAGLLLMEVDDGSSVRPQLRDAGTDSLSGRGLFLVDAIASSWGVSSDGTRTWCTLNPLEQERRSECGAACLSAIRAPSL